MSKLKVAICLSGLIGSKSKGGEGETVDFRLAKKYFDKNLINDKIDVSFFLHCWKNNYHKEILNYMSIEQYKLRSNLTSSLIKNIQLNRNVNSENSYKFFEISNVFGNNLSRVLTCVAHGDKHDENWAAKKRKFDNTRIYIAYWNYRKN